MYVPEVADYELRRELLRMSASKQISRLDSLKAEIGYAAITTNAMLKAAPDEMISVRSARAIQPANCSIAAGSGCAVPATGRGAIAGISSSAKICRR